MILPLLFLAAAAACTPVHGPMLLGSDMAAADTQYAAIPPDTAVSYAPSPGARRVLPEAEVARIVQRFGIQAVVGPICFEYAMRKLENAEIVAAIKASVPHADVELLETGNFAVPEGKLIFPLTSLPRPPQSRPDDAVVWRGFIEYAQGRKFSVWARVRISVENAYFVVLKDIPAGTELTSSVIEVKAIRGFPSAEHFAERTESVLGRRTVRSLRANQPLPLNALQTGEQTVVRGDEVMVEVEAGAAHLKIPARAETAAALGEAVRLRNPKSGKVFEAKVTGKGTANVVTTEKIQ